MTDLHIRVDAKDAIGLMGRISDNYPRARTQALNRTAQQVNIQLQRDARSRMLIRNQVGRWMLNWYAPIDLPRVLRATDTKPYATPVLPEKSGKILRPYETGEPKIGTPGKPVAIPTRLARPTPMAVIPKRLFPASLFPETANFTIPKNPAKWRRGKGRGGDAYLKAKPFILSPYTPGSTLRPTSWGIYQRVGKGRGDIKMLWAFRQAAKRPDLLDTYATARRVIEERWVINMSEAFQSIVRGGKGKASLLDLTV